MQYVTGRNSGKWLTVLIVLWYPLSCGIVEGLSQKIFGSLQIQHVLMLFILAIAAGFRIGKSISKSVPMKCNRFFLVYAGYILLTTYFFSGHFHFVLNLIGITGVYLFAEAITVSMPFERFLKALYIASSVFIVVSWAYFLLEPDASVQMLWHKAVLESFYDQKNAFGRFLTLSIFIIIMHGLFDGFRLTDAAFLILGGSALIFSQSRTSEGLTLLMLVSVWLFYYRQRLVAWTLIAGTGIALLLLLGAIMGWVGFYHVGSHLDGMQVFGVHLPLSGRATIWTAVVSHIEQARAWWFGFGYRVYFDTIGPLRLRGIGLGPDFVPNDPHNGYLDILLNFGWIGIAFFSVWIGRYVFLIYRLRGNKQLQLFASVFIVLLLAGNLTESYFVKTTNVFVFLFWVSYLYLEKAYRHKTVLQV